MSLFLPVIEAFNREKIEYVVVGGLAVILHGYVRLTTDLDVVVRLTEGNAASAVRALSRLGFKPRAPVRAEEFADAVKRKQWIEEKNMRVFSFYTDADPLFDVDLFVDHPKDFGELFAASVIKEVDGTGIRVCGLDHLIQLKEASGRPKDLVDLKALSEIRRG